MIFGSRHEKFVAVDTSNVLQSRLFADDKIGENVVVKTTLIPTHEKIKTVTRVQHPRRNPLPDGLCREVIELQPGEDVSGLKPVGKETTEILEYKPGEMYVKQFLRPEYIKPTPNGFKCKTHYCTAALHASGKKYCRGILAGAFNREQVCRPPAHLPPVRNI